MRVKMLTAGFLVCLVLTGAAGSIAADETDSFSDAFTLVPQNPLPGDLPYLLTLISREVPPEDNLATEAPLSPLAKAAANFAALIETDGVFYVQSTSVQGMSMESEHWRKGGKFKKNDLFTGQVILFDGQWLYQYSAEGKTGVRMAPDNPDARDIIDAVRDDRLSSAAEMPYQQQGDENVGGFGCQVFSMDFKMENLSVSCLYIDKVTGALVKDRFGEGEEGMSVTMTRLEVGGFGDDVFAVPGNIAFTEP